MALEQQLMQRLTAEMNAASESHAAAAAEKVALEETMQRQRNSEIEMVVTKLGAGMIAAEWAAEQRL